MSSCASTRQSHTKQPKQPQERRASRLTKRLLRPIGHFIVCPGKIQKVLPTLGALGIRGHGAAFVGCLSPPSDFCFFLFPLVGH
jgi:hypothetical protein